VYALHQRFFAKSSLVRLGGAEAKRGEARNYFVVMRKTFSNVQLAVDSIRVNRSVAEQAVCRSRPCMLANFGIGDPLYCDRDYVLSELPLALKRQQPNLVAVLTAQSDKRSFSTGFLRFCLSKPSFVLLGFDSRASATPPWVTANGFERLDINLPGPDLPYYMYHMWGRRFPKGEVVLGPNGGMLSGAKRMYIVLCFPTSTLTTTSTTSGNSQKTAATQATPPSWASKAEARRKATAHFWDPTFGLADRKSKSATATHKKKMEAAAAVAATSGAVNSGAVGGGTTDETKGDSDDQNSNQNRGSVVTTGAGEIFEVPPPFDGEGRRWSQRFNVDAIK
jgi:hypothetical protein